MSDEEASLDVYSRFGGAAAFVRGEKGWTGEQEAEGKEGGNPAALGGAAAFVRGEKGWKGEQEEQEAEGKEGGKFRCARITMRGKEKGAGLRWGGGNKRAPSEGGRASG